ncbi:MAG: helix-turn-helix transcriptional regulator [Synergistaceae bacterium]|nr:helix-turn-helix transcriptional regulator [Synergistaceae bacterium]
MSEEKETFGERLRRIRKKAGLTQEELAHLSGVAVTSIRRWEWGIQLPLLEKIPRLASALKVPENELLSEPQQDHWVLHIKVAENYKEEIIDMTENMPCISNFVANPNGASVELAGKWEIFFNDEEFNNFVQQLRDAREDIQRIGKKFIRGYKKNPQSDN